MSKGIFGGLFDFNGDGDLNVFEQAAEFAFFQKVIETEEKTESCVITDDDDDGISFDFEIGDSEEDEDWRDLYLDDEMGVDPDEYDTEEEYHDAVAEKKAWMSCVPDKISSLAEELLIEPEDYDSYEDFIEAVKDEL